jgi:hypothetical protein
MLLREAKRAWFEYARFTERARADQRLVAKGHAGGAVSNAEL